MDSLESLLFFEYMGATHCNRHEQRFPIKKKKKKTYVCNQAKYSTSIFPHNALAHFLKALETCMSRGGIYLHVVHLPGLKTEQKHSIR